MGIGNARLRQDLHYLFQGFLASLVVLWVVGLVLAAIALVLLSIAPGSIGESLRTLLPLSQLMGWVLFGAIVAIALLWLLPRWGLFPPRISERLRWVVGTTATLSMVLSALLAAIVL